MRHAKRYCHTWLGPHSRALPVYIKRGCAALLFPKPKRGIPTAGLASSVVLLMMNFAQKPARAVPLESARQHPEKKEEEHQAGHLPERTAMEGGIIFQWAGPKKKLWVFLMSKQPHATFQCNCTPRLNPLAKSRKRGVKWFVCCIVRVVPLRLVVLLSSVSCDDTNRSRLV